MMYIITRPDGEGRAGFAAAFAALGCAGAVGGWVAMRRDQGGRG